MHLRQLPSGSWRVIVKRGGRTRSSTASTRELAQERGAELYIELGGHAVHVEQMAVAELVAEHLAKQPLARSTRAEYAAVVANHLPAWFASRSVASVNPVIIDQLYRELETKTTAHQVRKVQCILSGAFKRAIRKGLLTINPRRDADVPSEPEADTYTPSTDEARRLLTACDEISPAFGLFVRIAAQSGARRGEVLALQRRDVRLFVDTDGDGRERLLGELSVLRAIARDGSTPYVDLPKTKRKGQRKVGIGPRLAARLLDYLDRQAVEIVNLDGTVTADCWLFTDDYRTTWYPTTPTSWWARARDAAGMTETRVRMNDLRHYVPTELYAASFDDQTAMRRLGHSNPVLTSKRYATSKPARDMAAAEHLDAVLEG